MTGSRSRSFGPLLLLSFAALSCGSTRQLQSVSIQPAQASASGNPVQFTAKGIFSGSSSVVTLTSKDVLWCYGGTTSVATSAAGVCAGNVNQFATVDQNGVAHCTSSSFHGSVYILAGKAMSSMNPDTGPQLKVFGSATLTCP